MSKPQLFLLHFAGGNCYSYQYMTPMLKNFDVVSLELPGRGKRAHEPLLNDFNQAADDMFRQLIGKLTSSRFMLYGHSMGAYLALRICHRLEKSSLHPFYLVVSGNPGPGITYDDKKKRHQLFGKEFTDELKMLGGVPEEVLENKELFSFFEPILRADFEIAEENRMGMEPPVQAPLFAMMGSEEKKTDQIANWGRFTRSDFDYEILPGDHFFIHKHPRRIAGIFDACYHKSSGQPNTSTVIDQSIFRQ